MHLLEELPEGDAAVDVGAEDIQAGDLLGDDVEVLEIAVRHRDGARGVHLLDARGRLAEERVHVARADRVGLFGGQILRLGRAPHQPVVVLVAEEPHEEAGRAAEVVHHLLDLAHDRRARPRIRIVRVRAEDAVHRDPVARHRVVEDREDPVALVDVPDPLRRDPHVGPDRVAAHRLQERHLALQRRLDDVVGLAPEAVVVGGADREIVPVDAPHHHVAAVDPEAGAGVVGDELDVRHARRGGLGRGGDLGHGGCEGQETRQRGEQPRGGGGFREDRRSCPRGGKGLGETAVLPTDRAHDGVLPGGPRTTLFGYRTKCGAGGGVSRSGRDRMLRAHRKAKDQT